MSEVTMPRLSDTMQEGTISHWLKKAGDEVRRGDILAEIEKESTVRTITGQLMLTYEWSDWRNGNFWWIQSVYVAEAFRGNGIFRALFRHVQALARARPDVCGLRLYMDAHNNRARQAYERLGLKLTNYELFEMDFL